MVLKHCGSVAGVHQRLKNLKRRVEISTENFINDQAYSIGIRPAIISCVVINAYLNKLNCYIANAKTKRNWLIRGHVALDKCNVSLGKQVKNCCPATNIKKTKWRRNSQV